MSYRGHGLARKLASDWGLFFNIASLRRAAVEPFGITRFNLARERGVDTVWNWFGNREGMTSYWRADVLENRDLAAVWPVGMQGTDDRAYRFPTGTSDSAQNATFREVIRTQVGS